MNNYKEAVEIGNSYREMYLKGIEALIQYKQAQADILRKEYIKDIIKEQQKFRKQFAEMLGWPLTEVPNKDIPKVKETFVTRDKSVTVYRLQIEVFKDFFYYGILFVKNVNEKLPLVISQHGGGGTPELCSGFSDSGSANYNEMTQRILEHDAHVFAPQMLLWNKEIYQIDYDRHHIDSQLKQLGGSITALEIYCLKRSIDYLSTLHYIDEEKIGMIGLSYGGFYTLFTAAVDERIKSCISSCFFNNRYKYAWTDWTWFDAAHKFLDSEIALLVYPRKLFIQIGDKDELFDIDSGLEEFERLKQYCNLIKDENWVTFLAFDGTHEFCHDAEPIKLLINDLNHNSR